MWHYQDLFYHHPSFWIAINHVCSVAIALSPHACSSWKASGIVFYPISKRIIHIRLKTHLSYASVIAIYAFTNPVSANAEASMQSDNLLQDTLSSVPCQDMVIILGDLDARVGSYFLLHSSVIGCHGHGECNENGTRLLGFRVSNQLLITNIWFQHKPLHQATWYRSGGCSRLGHTMDFVLINCWFCSSVLDTRVFFSTYHVSDHEIVVSTMSFKIKAKRSQTRVWLCWGFKNCLIPRYGKLLPPESIPS